MFLKVGGACGLKAAGDNCGDVRLPLCAERRCSWWGRQAATREAQARAATLAEQQAAGLRSPKGSGTPGMRAGDVNERLREMHSQIAEQELQLTAARAENQVPPPPLPLPP